MSDVVIKMTIDAGQLQSALKDVKSKLTEVGAKDVDLKTDRAETKIRSLRDSVAMWGLAIQGAVNAFRMVGTAINSIIEPAIDAEKGMSRVRAAVESTGMAAGFTAEHLQKMAGEYQKLYAFDDDELMNDLTTPLLTFTNITGEAFEGASVAVMNMTRALGTDLQGNALQVGKALNDPLIGLTALTRSGVSFTAQQKEVIKSLTETGQVAEAQKLILAELNKEFGGQAAAYAESYGGKLATVKNAFEDMKQALGEALLPTITDLTTRLTPLIEKLGVYLAPILEKLGQAIFPLLSTVIEALLPIFDAIMPIIDALMPVITALSGALGRVVTEDLAPC